MWKNGSQCEPLPNVRRDFPIYIARMEGREDIDWLLDDIAKDGDEPPVGGKSRLIRREGFASRISKDARPHDPGGGTTRFPVPQIEDDASQENAHGHEHKPERETDTSFFSSG